MNAPLYTVEILRLAASLPEPKALERVDGWASVRAPTCGSRVLAKVQLAQDGRVEAISQEVHACAFGQASASLLASHANGRTAAEVDEALTVLAAWLEGTRDEPGDWPGMTALAPARSRKARHPAILLPFRALLAAMREGKG